MSDGVKLSLGFFASDLGDGPPSIGEHPYRVTETHRNMVGGWNHRFNPCGALIGRVRGNVPSLVFADMECERFGLRD